jgi:hypothetical protein
MAEVICHRVTSDGIKNCEYENTKEQNFVSCLNLQSKITINVRVEAYNLHKFFDKIMLTFRKVTMYPNSGLK